MTVAQRPAHRPISRGIAMTETGLRRFLSQPRSASLAYTRRDGSAFVVPVWFRWRDGRVLVGTGAGDPKVAAIRRAPRVSVLVHEDRPPYRVVILDGDARVEVLAPDADDPTDGIAVDYLGRMGGRVYEQQMAATGAFDAGRAIITVTPDVIRSNDGSAALPRPARWYAALRYRLPVPSRWL